MGWIDLFHRQIAESSASGGLDARELRARFSGLFDVSWLFSL